MATKQEQIIVGLDPATNTVTILKTQGTGHKQVAIEQLEIDAPLIKGKRLFDVLDLVFSSTLPHGQTQTPAPEVSIVLPDNFVTTDIITLPAMTGMKLQQVLKANIKSTYPNLDEMQVAQEVLSKTKKRIIYAVSLVPKAIVQDCIMACKKHSLNLKNVTHFSSATISAFLTLGKAPKNAFLYLDVKETQSRIIYSWQGKTLAYFTLPFGQNFLSVDTENFLANHSKALFAEKELFSLTSQATDIAITGAMADDQAEKFKAFLAKRVAKSKSAKQFVDSLNPSATTLQNNFDVFVRHLQGIRLGLAAYDLPLPEIAIINAPAATISALAGVQSDLALEPLKAHVPEDCIIGDFFDIYGALHANKYNPIHSFLGKEKQSLFKRK